MGFGAELILIENLDAGRRRLKDKELAILSADVKFAVGQHRRGLLNRSQLLEPEPLSRGNFERRDVRAVVTVIEPMAVDYRGRETPLKSINTPLDAFFFQIALRTGIERHHQTHLT